MNIPEIHMIQTEIESIQAFRLSIPSPFEDNKVLSALVEVYPQPNRKMYIEFWGTLPAFDFAALPEQRAKFASGYVSCPYDKSETCHPFCDNLEKVVAESAVFADGLNEMLTLHKNAYDFPFED